MPPYGRDLWLPQSMLLEAHSDIYPLANTGQGANTSCRSFRPSQDPRLRTTQHFLRVSDMRSGWCSEMQASPALQMIGISALCFCCACGRCARGHGAGRWCKVLITATGAGDGGFGCAAAICEAAGRAGGLPQQVAGGQGAPGFTLTAGLEPTSSSRRPPASHDSGTVPSLY